MVLNIYISIRCEKLTQTDGDFILVAETFFDIIRNKTWPTQRNGDMWTSIRGISLINRSSQTCNNRHLQNTGVQIKVLTYKGRNKFQKKRDEKLACTIADLGLKLDLVLFFLLSISFICDTISSFFAKHAIYSLIILLVSTITFLEFSDKNQGHFFV